MIKLGVFYCPENDLKNNIESIKSYFASRSQTNKYLDHLVHTTIYVFDTDLIELNQIIKEFESLQNKLHPQSLQITNWRVFENDILTSLNTLCLEIKLTNHLRLFQENIVKALSKFNSNERNSTFNGDLKRSNDKYGYPFVGKHWIPHLTIGSLEIESNKILDYTDGLFEFSRKIVINNLCLFKIEGDSHLLIKKIEF
jgi:2'-5' RNA ligase